MRKLRRRRAAFRAAGLEEDARTTSIRLNRLEEEYHRFSKAAGLVEQRDRMNVEYVDQVSTGEAARLKEQRGAEAPIRQAIRSGEYPLTINPEKQARHMQGTATPGRSVITIPMEELQEIINAKAGSGEIKFKRGTYEWKRQEIIDAGKEIGYTINEENIIKIATKIKIHYSKTGVHAVPHRRG